MFTDAVEIHEKILKKNILSILRRDCAIGYVICAEEISILIESVIICSLPCSRETSCKFYCEH